MTKKVGLALGGGGARGWAHIGVIRALEEHNVPIDYIAGTSIGALVGAIYVHGELHKLENFATDITTDTLVSMMDISFPGLGLVDGKHVRNFLHDYLVDAQIEATKIPFRCVATNFLLKQEVIFDSGSMVDAVRASISLPGVFAPVQREGSYLVDGGVMNPVPVNVVQNMGADMVIAVNLNSDSRKSSEQSNTESAAAEAESTEHNADDSEAEAIANDTTQNHSATQDWTARLAERYQDVKQNLQEQVDDWMPDPSTGINIFDVIGNSMNIMEQQVTRVRLETDVPDILIQPDLMQFGIFDFQEARPMIQQGYEQAESAIPEIKACLDDQPAES